MEHLWSPAGATGGNRWQMGRARKPLKQADPQPVATHGNPLAAHGKEGVDRRASAVSNRLSSLVRVESSRTSSGSTVRVYDLTPRSRRRKRQPLPAGGDAPVMHGPRPTGGGVRRRAGGSRCGRGLTSSNVVQVSGCGERLELTVSEHAGERARALNDAGRVRPSLPVPREQRGGGVGGRAGLLSHR
jgi:hypothetical protein